MPEAVNRNPRVVIVGAGFAGLACAKRLSRGRFSVTVVDRGNYHLFQPLLYQVATAGLSPAEIAVPIRAELSDRKDTEVLLAEVVGIDRASKKVMLRTRLGADAAQVDRHLFYDYLVLAPGARHHYFGHPEWEEFAPGLKQISDATQIRKRVLLAFERAEMAEDPVEQTEQLTFAVVGGGPTGVELAGALAELATRALRKDFRRIDPTRTRVVLVEAGPRLLSQFSPALSDRAEIALHSMGVEVQKGSRVTHVDARGIQAGTTWIPARTVIWAAGVICSPVGKWLGLETQASGQVSVHPDLSVPGSPEIFVAGDVAAVPPVCGGPLPGIAPVAMQQGRFVADRLNAGLPERQVFRYKDKGSLATIGRKAAVGVIAGREVQGFIAWIVWALVHIYYLVGFKNRLFVLAQWVWAYASFKRGARIIQEN